MMVSSSKTSKHVKKKKKETMAYEDKFTQELAELVEALTHSGKKSLDLPELKKVKNICKRSDKYIKEIYNMIIEHLEENHAEVRVSAFQLCSEIFKRSHWFREQVLFNFEHFVQLTTGPGLPQPPAAARHLKTLALKTIHEWNERFGDKYKKLSLAYNYLRNVEKIDFTVLDVVDASTQARQQEIQRRKEAVNAVRIKNVLVEIREKKAEIIEAANSLSNCINLLLPHPDDFFIAEDEVDQPVQPTARTFTDKPTTSCDNSGSEDDCADTGYREVGMVDAKHCIQIDFMPSSEACIEETPDNSAIIENTQEYARLIINKYLPTVKTWLEILSNTASHKEELQSIVELKGDLDDVTFKFSRITFSSVDDVSSDSDLEEVPQLKETKPAREFSAGEDASFWSMITKKEGTGDPAALQSTAVMEEVHSSNSQDSGCEPSPSSSKAPDRKQKLLAVAPKLPFDVDLYHWEDEKLPVPTMIPSNSEGHRFWVNSDSCLDELPVPDGVAALRTRVIEFTGSFTPITHSCKVRLPSGRLCPRRDRVKCPFHGEIVPRDETGKCINPKDAERMQALAEKRQQEKPDWQDPKLLAEIKKATGIDLKMPEKGKRKKKKKEYPGLTDLKGVENTVTKRLERKIFKKSVMKKVATAMDKIDQRKFRDKFGDQFNYFHS